MMQNAVEVVEARRILLPAPGFAPPVSLLEARAVPPRRGEGETAAGQAGGRAERGIATSSSGLDGSSRSRFQPTDRTPSPC
jgi:hypothetical protein